MLVRIVYAVVQAFLNNPSNPNHNTWVYFGLLLIPDFVSVALYTVFGYVISKVPKKEDGALQLESGYALKEGVAPNPGAGGGEQPTYQQPVYQDPAQNTRRGRRTRRRGPILMLIGAIRGE